MANFCRNCGNALTATTKFCDRCGMQTSAEQAAIQAERTQNAEANMDKGMGGTIGLTVTMAIFSLLIVLLFGFEDGEGVVASSVAIGFSVIICSIKWFFEIKFQRRLKKEAREKAEAEKRGNYVL